MNALQSRHGECRVARVGRPVPEAVRESPANARATGTRAGLAVLFSLSVAGRALNRRPHDDAARNFRQVRLVQASCAIALKPQNYWQARGGTFSTINAKN